MADALLAVCRRIARALRGALRLRPTVAQPYPSPVNVAAVALALREIADRLLGMFPDEAVTDE